MPAMCPRWSTSPGKCIPTTSVNYFRIDIPVALEGTLADLGDVDLSSGLLARQNNSGHQHLLVTAGAIK